MSVAEVYLKSSDGIDDVANMLRSLLNLPGENRNAWQKDQRRESSNRGGLYYLFEVLGVVLELLSNKEEASIPERFEWPYYIMVHSETADVNEGVAGAIADLVRCVLKENGVDAEIDTLT